MLPFKHFVEHLECVGSKVGLVEEGDDVAIRGAGVGDVELAGEEVEEAEGGPRVFEATDRSEGDGRGDDVAE